MVLPEKLLYFISYIKLFSAYELGIIISYYIRLATNGLHISLIELLVEFLHFRNVCSLTMKNGL